MNERILLLAREAAGGLLSYDAEGEWKLSQKEVGRFVDLLKQAIYDDVKEELMDDSIINEEPSSSNREYLRGCNGGTVDALCHIKNFGVDIEE